MFFEEAYFFYSQKPIGFYTNSIIGCHLYKIYHYLFIMIVFIKTT